MKKELQNIISKTNQLPISKEIAKENYIHNKVILDKIYFRLELLEYIEKYYTIKYITDDNGNFKAVSVFDKPPP